VAALWSFAVETSPEAEDALSALFEEVFGLPAIAYLDHESGLATITAYLRQPPSRNSPQMARLLAGIRKIQDCGLEAGPAKIRLARVKKQDWAESWKRHFKPLAIGTSLLILPSWSRQRPRKGQALLVLDPGLSFGTGQHPTTAFCLRQIAATRRADLGQSFLDLGTGSGILAIAAAKLGYKPISAIDFDPQAIRIARRNARANGVVNRINFSVKEVAELSTRRARSYSLICANLIANILITERQRIVAQMAPTGTLVLAGILATEFPQVEEAYVAIGLRKHASRTEREWCSAAFVRRSNV
jgi:ribosomal protein L11 methyltransferase